jgi:hypothetical protein
VKETEIQAAILDYLRLKGRFFWRNNSGAFKTERGGFFRVGTPGAPDMIGCVASGGSYHVVRSIDDVAALGL